MTLQITHDFVSTLATDAAATARGEVTPDRWNAALNAVMASGFLLGRSSAGNGPVQELDAATARALLGIVLGTGAGNVPLLDGSGKLATSVLPESVVGSLKYKGGWNAATNSPAIPAAAAGNLGWYYIVTTAGATSVSGVNDWQIGDWIVSNGTSWDKIDSSDQVIRVAGLQGDISGAALKAALNLVIGTDVQAYSALLASIAGLNLAGKAGQALVANAGGTGFDLAVASGALPTLIVRDEKPNDTYGGSSAVGWQARTLNTVKVNTISGASLSANRVTLPAGTYLAEATVPAYKVNAFKSRIRNITDGTDLAIGSSEICSSEFVVSAASTIMEYFTISATKIIELQMYGQTASSTAGFGYANNAGTIEVFSMLKLSKVA